MKVKKIYLFSQINVRGDIISADDFAFSSLDTAMKTLHSEYKFSAIEWNPEELMMADFDEEKMTADIYYTDNSSTHIRIIEMEIPVA